MKSLQGIKDRSHQSTKKKKKGGRNRSRKRWKARKNVPVGNEFEKNQKYEGDKKATTKKKKK